MTMSPTPTTPSNRRSGTKRTPAAPGANAAPTISGQGDDASNRPLERILSDRIRREFFARAGTTATLYGISADDLLRHAERANLADTPGPARALSYVEDLVLAVACVRGHPRAWSEAWTTFEATLLRAARMRLDEADALVFTRRFWIDLHAASTRTREPESAASARAGSALDRPFPSMAEFVGVRPLRVWLTDRLLGRVEVALASRGGWLGLRPPKSVESVRRRRLAPEVRLRLVD